VTPIEPGVRVVARSADDKLLERRAVSGVTAGLDFEVVWVCPEDEWKLAIAEGREPTGVPWPAEAVEPVRD